MKKIFCSVLLILNSSLWSQENLSVEEYKEFLNKNYLGLYNYLPGSVFLNVEYLEDHFPENLDPASTCHTNSYKKETLIVGSFGEGKYYALEETWLETHCNNREQDKISEINKEIVQNDMIFPTLDLYFQPQIDENVSIRVLDNNTLELVDLKENEKYIFDYSRPLKFIKKEKIREGKIIEEIRRLSSINSEELLPKLKGIPVYLQFLNQMGFTSKVKVSDDFLEFWEVK